MKYKNIPVYGANIEWHKDKKKSDTSKISTGRTAELEKGQRLTKLAELESTKRGRCTFDEGGVL